MPTVVLASSLARWLTASPTPQSSEKRFTIAGETVRDVLDNLFAVYPHLRGYVMDEAGAIRHHVVVYVNDSAIDKSTLADAIAADCEIYLFQALSGG